jgi:hypothetical protein
VILAPADPIYALRVRVILAALVTTCAAIGDARADFRFAIANDVFTAARPLGSDDNGFTNDLDFSFWRPYRAYLVGGRLYDRWITEETPIGGRRRDLVDLLATVERTWGAPARSLRVAARFGPTFTGNLGGRWMQNAFHTTCRCGRPLDAGLQDTYEGDNDAGVLAGTRAVGAAGTAWAQGYATADLQGSLGTGVSSVEGALGGRLLGNSGNNRFGGHVEIAVNRFHVDDERLAIPGGYRSGWQSTWRAGVYYARGRVRVDFEYRDNEDSSGQPIGVLAFTIKQAGTAF